MSALRPSNRWELGRNAMVGTLWLGAVWGSLLVVAVLRGRDANVIGDMFAGVCALMVTTLAVLVGGKGWKEYANARGAGLVQKQISEGDSSAKNSEPVGE